MTDDERAAMVEQIARALCRVHFLPDDTIPTEEQLCLIVDRRWRDWLDQAEPILAAIEPAIRADEREKCIHALEPCEGTIGGQNVDFVMGRAYERSANIAAIRALTTENTP